MKRKIIIGLAAVLVLIQFIPYHIENEEVDLGLDFLSQSDVDSDIADLIRAACYDCHSQEAKTPWYGHIAPVKFWLNKHVRGGRMNVDFSQWATLSEEDRQHTLEECVEVLEDEEMPLNSYTWLHPEARLSEHQRSQLIAFFRQLKQN